jgi:hypothetical protein
MLGCCSTGLVAGRAVIGGNFIFSHASVLTFSTDYYQVHRCLGLPAESTFNLDERADDVWSLVLLQMYVVP